MSHSLGQRSWFLAAMAADPRCHYCLEPVAVHPPNDGRTRRATVDHIVPRAYGGTNAKLNLVIACFSCNQEKAHALVACWCERCCDALAYYATKWLDPETAQGYRFGLKPHVYAGQQPRFVSPLASAVRDTR